MATISEALAIAIQHHEGGRLQAAEQIYRQILEVEPSQPDALHNLGVLAHQVGKHEVAIEYIGKAIGVHGTNATFYVSLGNVYRALQRTTDSIACYQRAIHVAPGFADAHYRLGNSMMDQWKLEEAVNCYRRALELKPDYAEAYSNLGVALENQGHLDEAVASYRQVVQLRPNDVEPHNNLGVALRYQGKLDEAVACYRRALELNPNDPEVHNNLGVALQDQGKLDEAVASYPRALELKPDYVEAHYNLGFALLRQGRATEAVGCCLRAVQLKPNDAKMNYNLGVALQDQGKLDEAVVCYRRALELKPDFAEAHNNQGNVFWQQGKPDEAVACYRRALELKPDYAEAHNNLGAALWEQGKLDEAEACYRLALALKPDYAEAHYNLGTAFNGQGKLDEAEACYRRALELKPDYAEAHNNLGAALWEQGKRDEAEACYRRALEPKPDFAESHWNRSLIWLLGGDFAHGWSEYEWRWQRKESPPRIFQQPVWDGGHLEGKTILLHAEQGLGDTIQFIRYASTVKQLGGTVCVECQKPLLRLLEGCPGIDQLIGQGNDLPTFDAHVPLLSVPGILKTSLETIPATIPYLLPQPALLEQWRKRLIELNGFKIGITWQGNPMRRGDRFRSIPLRYFAPLAQISGVRLISLQKGAGTEQLAEVRTLFPITDLAGELDQQSGPFMDTAAVMKGLDLVICSDTAAAHLAGALGVPVWVALSFAPDWRWLLDRADSPWYPTMRLFRQPSLGDWAGVFEEMHSALCEQLQCDKKVEQFIQHGGKHEQQSFI